MYEHASRFLRQTLKSDAGNRFQRHLLSLTAITNKIIGRILVLDHVESLLDLMLGLLRG
jgi:hypothetical protein